MENVENTTKTNKITAMVEKYKKSYKEHPVKTILGTVGAGVAAGLVVYGGVKLVKAMKAPAIDIPDVEPEALTAEHFGTNLPDSLGFDKMKLVNKEGEILAESIIDMGEDYIVADEYNIVNMVKELGDAEAIEEAINMIDPVVVTVTEA